MEKLITNSKTISTRNIRLFIDIPSSEKENLIDAYRKLFDWQKFAFKSANLTVTNLYIQDQLKELIYLQDDVRVKLADRCKDSEGVLNCSRENTTYRLLSNKFKNEIPASVFSLINRSVYKDYNSEKLGYYAGDRSLRCYKSSIPIPFTSKSIHNLRWDDKIKNFRFSLFQDEKYHIPFRTYLGRDRSNNRIIIECCLNKTYRMCDSKIQIKLNRKTKKHELYLILTFEVPKEDHKLNPELTAKVKLSFLAPIIINFNGKETNIGDKECFIYKCLAIQHGFKRRQSQMKYNKGGKGRPKKMKGVEEYMMKERNFIDTYMHKLSHDLVGFCINNKIGKLVVDDVKQSIEDAKEFPFVIRNWSYGNLLQKLEHKCIKKNIELSLS